MEDEPIEPVREKTLLGKFIPVVDALYGYSIDDALYDLITGITIGLIILPQSIAYINFIGISPSIGILGVAIGGLVYTVFGTVKEISISPTAITAILTYEYTNGDPVALAGLFSFCVGCATLILLFLKLATIVEFISLPVTDAFSSAVVIKVIVSESRELFGLKYSSKSFIESAIKLVQNIKDYNVPDVIVSASFMTFLVILQKIKIVVNPDKGKFSTIIHTIAWILTKSRNAIALIVGAIVSQMFLNRTKEVPYRLVANVAPGFPETRSPFVGNSTSEVLHHVESFGIGVFVVPLTALLIHTAISKAFSHGTMNVTFELLVISLCSFIASFFGSVPMSGAFSRIAVSRSVGVRTTISNIYAVLISLFALAFLSEYIGLLPRAGLSVVIIVAISSVIKYRTAWILIKSSRKDLTVFIVTFAICTIFSVQYGLVFGPLVNLAFAGYAWAHPDITLEKRQSECGAYVRATPKSGILYIGVERLWTGIMEMLVKEKYANFPIVIDCSFLSEIDYTALVSFQRMTKDFLKNNRKIIFCNVPKFISDMVEKGSFDIPLTARDINDKNICHVLGTLRNADDSSQTETSTDSTTKV